MRPGNVQARHSRQLTDLLKHCFRQAANAMESRMIHAVTAVPASPEYWSNCLQESLVLLLSNSHLVALPF